MFATPPANMDVGRQRLFRRVMQKYDLSPEEVDENRAQFNIHNVGAFVCKGCGHAWESAFSWLTLDLRELEVRKWWAMMCRHCLTLCYPSFLGDQLERMFDIAVQLYKGVYKPRGKPHLFQRPHKPHWCEMCEWGYTMCWRSRLHRQRHVS